MPSNSDIISNDVLINIITATLLGTLARCLLIKLDYRQYPSHPNGLLIHAVTGALAAAIGAFIIPAILAKEYTAVTFLALGIQHFRDVRRIERDSLLDLEGEEYTRRGYAYIDGIAKIFESRNYIALLVSFATGLTIQLIQSLLDVPIWIGVICGSIVGFVLFYFLKLFTRRQKVDDIATVIEGKITITGSDLYVDGLFITHLVGRKATKEMFLEDGLAAIVSANHIHYQIPLLNKGQRQAILYEVTRRMGQRNTFSIQQIDNGKLIIVLVPTVNNFDLLKETILLTPLLETVKKNTQLLNKSEVS